MILYLLFIQFLIATSFITNKIILLSLPIDFFLFLRMGVSGLLLFFLFCRNKNVLKNLKENFFEIFLITIFTTFLPSLLKSYAISNITSSRAAFWSALEPFITAGYLYFLYSQKLTYRQFIGCGVGFLSSVFFVFTSSGYELIAAKICFFSDLAQIGCILASRYGWIKVQVMLKKNILMPEQLNSLLQMMASFLFLLISVFTGKNIFKYFFELDSKIILLFIYTVFIGNMLTYTLYGYALKKYNATLVSLSALSMPLFVHLLGPFIFNEKIYLSFFISLTFLFVGIYIFNKKDKKIY